MNVMLPQSKEDLRIGNDRGDQKKSYRNHIYNTSNTPTPEKANQ